MLLAMITPKIIYYRVIGNFGGSFREGDFQAHLELFEASMSLCPPATTGLEENESGCTMVDAASCRNPRR